MVDSISYQVWVICEGYAEITSYIARQYYIHSNKIVINVMGYSATAAAAATANSMQLEAEDPCKVFSLKFQRRWLGGKVPVVASRSKVYGASWFFLELATLSLSL